MEAYNNRTTLPRYPVGPPPPPVMSPAQIIARATGATLNGMRTAGPQPVMFPGGVLPPGSPGAPQPIPQPPPAQPGISQLPDLAQEAETAAFDPALLEQLGTLIKQAEINPHPGIRADIQNLVAKMTGVGTMVTDVGKRVVGAATPAAGDRGDVPYGPNAPALFGWNPQTRFGQDAKRVLSAVTGGAPPSPVPGESPEALANMRQGVIDYFGQDVGTAPRGWSGNMPGANLSSAETIALATGVRPPPAAAATTPATRPGAAPAPGSPAGAPAAPGVNRPTPLPIGPQAAPPGTARAGLPAMPPMPAEMAGGQPPNPATAAAATPVLQPFTANPPAAVTPAKDRFGLTEDARKNLAMIGAMTGIAASQPGVGLAGALAQGVVGGMAQREKEAEKKAASALKTRELNIQEANYKMQAQSRLSEIEQRRDAAVQASADRQEATAARAQAAADSNEIRRLMVLMEQGNKSATRQLNSMIAQGRMDDAAADHYAKLIDPVAGAMKPDAAAAATAEMFPTSSIGRRARIRTLTDDVNANLAKIAVDPNLDDAAKAKKSAALRSGLQQRVNAIAGEMMDGGE